MASPRSRSGSRNRSSGRTLVAASGGGGGGSATYQEAVMADTPWGFWRLQETSGNLADSSGNSRTMTVTGSPTYAQTGPSAALPAIQFATTALAATAASVTTSAATLEFWIYIPSGTISAKTPLFHLFQTSVLYDKVIYVDTDGNIKSSHYDGVTQIVSTPTPPLRDMWHHFVYSVGAAGTKFRLNKSTVATNASTSSYTGASFSVYLHGTNSNMTGTTTIRVAAPAFYTSQLSDTRTDAHFDAAGATGLLGLAATGGTLDASSTFGSAAANRAQDGDVGTEWMANNTIPCWLRVTYSGTKTIGAYRLAPMSSQSSRAPDSWTFEGSNNGSSWTVLDTQTSVPTWGPSDYRTYFLASAATYSQFRINVSAKQPSGDGYINIGEFWHYLAVV